MRKIKFVSSVVLNAMAASMSPIIAWIAMFPLSWLRMRRIQIFIAALLIVTVKSRDALSVKELNKFR